MLRPDWGIFEKATNTCILHAWLVLFYAPYLAQQILKPYPQLSGESILFSRSFSLLDINESDEAWILWINEEFSDRINSRTGSADLYDDTDHLVTIN